MNKKLTIADIADLISSKCGITKKEAEQFVKDFFAIAAEVISQGETLTIKGVGVFAPVWVGARTSVDVNTKESIEIPGHYKLSFTPDKTMKDAINAPFAAFTTEVIETVIEENENFDQAEEVKSDGQETAEEELSVEIDNKAEEYLLNEVVVPQEEQTEEKAEEQSEKNIDIDVKDIEEVENNNFNKQDSNSDYIIDEDKIKKEYRRRTRNGYISGFLTALIIVIIFICVWIFIIKDGKGVSISFSSFKITSVNEQNEEAMSNTEIINDEENNIESQVVETPKPLDDNTRELKEGPNKLEEVQNQPKEPIIETIERGKYLTTIANKYYGDKVFWVYIYRENDDRIWNPKDLKPGFKVVVPDAAKYNIDASNPESVKRAKELEKQILYEIE